MAKDHPRKQPGPDTNKSDGIDSSSWIGQAISKLIGFITRNFRRMPRWVQVVVYLIFSGTIVFAILITVKPDLLEYVFRPKPEPPEVEIRGRISGMNGTDIPDSLWSLELFAEEDLFVRKMTLGDQFAFQWILKVPKAEMGAQQKFSFLKYNPDAKKTQQLGRGTNFLRQDLYDQSVRSGDGKVHLALDYDFMELAMDTTGVQARHSTVRPGFALPALIPEAFAQPKTQKRPFTRDSIQILFKKYGETQNPAQQMAIRDILPEGGTPLMLELVDSLKKALSRGRKASVSDYVLALSDFDSLSLLTSGGRYQDRLDNRFYAKAVELLHTGNEFESRNTATFLQSLHDPRSLDYVFREFFHSNSPKPQRLCLYVLEGFSSSANAQARNRVKDWLDQTSRANVPVETKKTLKEIRTNFR